MNLKEEIEKIDINNVSKERLFELLKNLAENWKQQEDLIVLLRDKPDRLKKVYDIDISNLNESIALLKETIGYLKVIVEMRDTTIKELQDKVLQMEQKENDKGFLDGVPWFVYPIIGSIAGSILYNIFK